MGADKNSSRRMNSAYVPNSQPRISTRVCQGHVVTMDLPTLGANPKQSQSESETQEAKDLGDLRSPRRTVRNDRADSPRWAGGQSARPQRTVRKCNPNNQYCTSKYRRSVATPWTVRPARTVRQPYSNRKHPTRRIETKRRKNSQRTRRTTGWSAPRG
jgi:hypothetical protein